MRKPLTVILLTFGVIVAIPVLALTTTAIVNVVATQNELSRIADYGRRVAVDGKKLNVVDTGAGGETIVLLPGLGTAAPGLDFQPLIGRLASRYRVVAIEPFGTGLSDQTKVPRTAVNIAREVHEALQQLGIRRYVLMGHSIAGIYALEYSRSYADELIAFVGIDSSVPDQPGSDDPVSIDGMTLLRDLGLVRALASLGGDPYAGLPYSDATKEQMRFLSTKNALAPTLLDETARTRANFASVSGDTFPPTLPVLLFVVANDPELPGWQRLHEQQAASVQTGKVVALRGEHYLHHTQSAAIAEDTEAFLQTLPVR